MYPHLGYPLVPAALKSFLDVPVTAGETGLASVELRLSELDATVWQQFDYETCKKLSEIVVARLRERIALIRQSRIHIQVPPELTTIDYLQLDVRTYNCLKHEGFADHPEFLRLCTLGTLLGIRGFGMR